MRVLIDTNVILDVWLARQPFLLDSARILSAAEKKMIIGIICPTTVTTLHYLVKKHRGEAKARSLLNDLLRICTVGTFRKQEIEEALQSKIKDFEDAVIEAVALKTNVVVIATRNIADFKQSRVPAMEPQLIEW
ncbi:PIN domain-containing protein [Coraliomargarita parva]|uniref:PIN domain-containing protein n=1 Tax=Coraliomargarita parva TaxID=3014050 RepID=UPI0022B3642D|nr:PIN domain-containing protein [Coraliomargarita parva]